MPEMPVVRTAIHRDILIVTIDQPPINACTSNVRRGLIEAIAQLVADAELSAAIVAGAGDHFVSGSDLRELAGEIADPDLPAVIAAIEACVKPVVAAIGGAALGEGFELALGCDYRIASADACLGLPDITLGTIPGAGGTQRLPRLVGVARAIELVCRAERLAATQALAAGLLDEVVDGDLVISAIAFVRRRAPLSKRRIRDLKVAPADSERLDAVVTAALHKAKQRPPTVAAISAIRSSAKVDFDEGLSAERARFHQLRKSGDAESLRYLFHAERQTAQSPQLIGASPPEVSTIGVVGAGTMGTGIAIAALDGGYRVVLVERNDEALNHGRSRIAKHYAKRVASGQAKATTAAHCEARLLATNEWSALGSAELVIEAVFEELSAKLAVFSRLADVTPPGVVLATNTSYLDIDAIARVTGRARDVIGLHFFSPAQAMRLVEVVVGLESSPEAVAAGVNVAAKMQKLPVLTRNAHGFVGNRIFKAYRRQCELMVQEGAYPEDVDGAMEAFGMAMGPFAVADLSGLDIAWRMRDATGELRSASTRYPRFPDRLCEIGRLGRKTGAGYYDYDDHGRRSSSSSDLVRQLIDADSLEHGLLRRHLGPQDIQRRAVLAMVNEACHVLREGIVSRQSDVDVVLVNGYGFPRWLGGPVRWATRLSAERLRRELLWLSAVSADDLLPGDVGFLFD